jgi:phage N-6-adenine-methyltransferase
MPRPRLHKSNAIRQKAYRKRLKKSVHFKSKSVEWSTPQDEFDKLNAEFHFTLDVCAVAENAKCSKFYSPEQDGLMQPWTGVCFMNPPYGKGKCGIEPWVCKAYEASLYGATVVALIPSRTDTYWWHRYVTRAAHIQLLPGRIKFEGQKNGRKDSAPFPSALVIFKPTQNKTLSSAS